MSMPPSGSRPAYTKPWLAHADQVQHLVDRGLVVADVAVAQQFLSHINYYRFSGYCLAFEKKRHEFLDGATFEQIRAAYDFDVTLRDLLTEALEVIEVDFRSTVAYHFGQAHGAFGHTDPANFFDKFDHADWLTRIHEETDRSSELFVEHFRDNYAEYPDIPVWMLMEIMSFGVLTRMYRWMRRPDQKAIASRYGIQAGDFGTILLHLVYVRNMCAHHSRLWDRSWSVKAQLPRGKVWQPPLVPGNDRLFSTLLLTFQLLKSCPAVAPFPTAWRDRLKALLHTPPASPTALARMGMPADWEAHPVWA